MKKTSTNKQDEILSLQKKYSAEYDKAVDRIYGDLRQTLKHRHGLTIGWVLRFVNMNLESLSDGDWNNLAHEIVCFTEWGIDYCEYDLHKEDRITSRQDWYFLASPDKRQSPSGITTERMFWLKRIPSRHMIEELQRVTIKHITQLLANGETTFVIPETKVSVSKIGARIVTSKLKELDGLAITFDKVEEYVESDGSRKFECLIYEDRGRRMVSAKTPLTVFEYNLSEILTKFAPFISQCPECKIIFLASRKNKQFCSVRCQSRVNMRKYRNTPPERVGKRGRPTGTGKKKKELSKVRGGSSHGKAKRKS